MGRFGPVAARDWRSTERRKRSAAALAPLLGQPGAGLLGDPVGDAEPGRQGRDLQLEHERSGALRSVRGRNAAPLKGAAGCVGLDRKSTRLNSSHLVISYAVFCLKKKKPNTITSRHQTAVDGCLASLNSDREPAGALRPRMRSQLGHQLLEYVFTSHLHLLHRSV